MKHSSTFFTFFFLLALSLLLFFLSSFSVFQSLGYVVSFVVHPIQQSFYQTTFYTAQIDEKVKKVSHQNEQLRKKLVEQNKLVSENSALQDQFKTAHPSHSQLLPASIIGAPGFVPGVSQPDRIIIDRGSLDGVTKGQAVVSKDNLIGTITKVSPSSSIISLLISGETPLTAKTLETQALGVVNQPGGHEFALENVILSQQLKRGDMVLTKGDIADDGTGIPADLVIGEIIDIDKKPSSLFQTAKLKSLVDISSLRTVFIVQTAK